LEPNDIEIEEIQQTANEIFDLENGITAVIKCAVHRVYLFLAKAFDLIQKHGIVAANPLESSNSALPRHSLTVFPTPGKKSRSMVRNYV
jgi:hypothetical protein